MKAQPFGNQSKELLKKLVAAKRVRIVQQDIDDYDRIVGRIYLKEFDVNAEMIRKGMAWVYRYYLKDKSLLDIEKEARIAKRGPVDRS
ncbi:MAG: thermonuclease family protein [SAR324 cluster bacterium]|nr:thermonuclease family protein [SAR324 cluster bacterium]